MEDHFKLDVSAPTARELARATPFTKFEATLKIEYDIDASRMLGKDYWRVLEPFKFYVGKEEDNTWVYVPAGYLTDGASVPRPFWWLIPPWGRYGQAAVTHDVLCDTLTLFKNGEAIRINRGKADNVFKEALEVAGVSTAIRNLMYWAVRLFSKLKVEPDESERAQKRKLEAAYVQAA